MTKKKKSNELGKKSKSLMDKYKRKLDGAKFRILNEKLYTTSGNIAFKMFQKDPELFEIYHQGFSKQVETWPENPLDLIISEIKKTPKLVIGDFGCGEAKLAKTVKNKVYSYDLISTDPIVVPCDISKLPLPDSTLDVSVFCLSLMGTNVVDFLKEAHRIAEVKSRLESDEWFKNKVTELGWDFIKMNSKNKMFTIFEFRKNNKIPNNIDLVLKPCEYKRR